MPEEPSVNAVFILITAQNRRVRLSEKTYRTLPLLRPELAEIPDLILLIERALINTTPVDETVLTHREVYVSLDWTRSGKPPQLLSVVVQPLDDHEYEVATVLLMTERGYTDNRNIF